MADKTNGNDYHRHHFPVSGTILEVRKINGLDAVGGSRITFLLTRPACDNTNTGHLARFPSW
jgi:hypothetical protein